jgi:ArsR family transcriptional regulator
MATDKRLVSLENTFKALADQTRLRILGLLQSGEICVCDIHGSLGLPQPTVSRHLAYLRKSRLVDTRKDGLWVHYRLAQLPDPVMQALLDAVTHAIGHVEAGHRDRKRLATRIELAPVGEAPARRCC